MHPGRTMAKKRKRRETFVLSPEVKQEVVKFDLTEGPRMRSMFIQKRCPKCGGNVYIDKDYYYGWYEQCLQCSHTCYLETIVKVQDKITNGDRFLTRRNVRK